MNINSIVNEFKRDENKNIIYMQLYRLYNDKKAERIKSINLNFQKIEKKIKFYKFKRKQFYFIYEKKTFCYSCITNNDLYILSFLQFALIKQIFIKRFNSIVNQINESLNRLSLSSISTLFNKFSILIIFIESIFILLLIKTKFYFVNEIALIIIIKNTSNAIQKLKDL